MLATRSTVIVFYNLRSWSSYRGDNKDYRFFCFFFLSDFIRQLCNRCTHNRGRWLERRRRRCRGSRTSYDRYGRVLLLGHDGRAARDHGRQPVIEWRVRCDGQHGRLLPRGLFANRPDSVEAGRPEHEPDHSVHGTPDAAKTGVANGQTTKGPGIRNKWWRRKGREGPNFLPQGNPRDHRRTRSDCAS